MKLKHGNDRQTVIGRIEARAFALANGAGEEDLADPTDINSNEEREIALAKRFAADWIAGKNTEVFRLTNAELGC